MKKDSSNLLLLDVNVLLALSWPNHQFHATATRRMASGRTRWATCALTELGLIRLSTNPAAVTPALSPAEAVALVLAMKGDPLHVYLESLPSPVDNEFRPMLGAIHGNRQVTDAYLLALAREHCATFVTFDTRLGILADGRVGVEVLGL